MDNVINLDDYRKHSHFSAMALCLECNKRWIAGVTEQNSLFTLECPKCHAQNSFGSIIPQEYMKCFEAKND